MKQPQRAQELRAELDRLQAQLSSRRSTVHFARMAIALLVAFIFGGASTQVFSDVEGRVGQLLGYGMVGLSLGLVAFAVGSFLIGKGALKRELSSLEELRRLRRELRLDDPAALLPSR